MALNWVKIGWSARCAKPSHDNNSAATQYFSKFQNVCIHNRLQAICNNQHITQKLNIDWVMAFTVLGGLELNSTLKNVYS